MSPKCFPLSYFGETVVRSGWQKKLELKELGNGKVGKKFQDSSFILQACIISFPALFGMPVFSDKGLHLV